MKSRTWLVLAAVVVLGAVAWWSQRGQAAPGGDSADLNGTAWQLQQLDLGGRTYRPVEGWPSTLTFASGSVSGVAVCNGFGSNYAASPAGPAFEGVGMTTAGCPIDVENLEEALSNAILHVTYIEVEGDRLELLGDGVLARYVALAPATLEGISGREWRLVEARVPGQDVTISGRATLLVTPDGTFTGSTGCRSLGGTLSVSPDFIRVTTIRADGSCPAQGQAEEDAVLLVVERFRAEVAGDRLTLRAAGAELIYEAP